MEPTMKTTETISDPDQPGKNRVHGQEQSFQAKVVGATTAFFRSEISEMCTKEFLHRRLPFTKWAPQYTLGMFGQDMLAGLTVALTLIPQAIAYASVAGLEPQYGLYSSFMSCFMYILFGGCNEITIGPTAIMAIMTQGFVLQYNADFAVLLCFLTGCIIVLVGLLRLGFLVEFISLPVITGFISAAAITIASTQLKSLLGIGGKSNTFIEAWENLFNRIQNTNIGDLCLGIGTIILLLIGRKLKDFDVKRPSEVSVMRRVVGKICWITSISRNSILVIFGMILAFVLEKVGYHPFSLTGPLEEGLPSFDLPPFSTYANNKTMYFDDMVTEYGTSLFSVPFISILETIAIAKSFSKGKSVDATQELFALGFCNIMSSFVRSFPLAGSFSRTAVNSASGVRTQFGGIMSGVMVLLALGLLTSTFAYIPKATLAGVIMSAVLFMVEYEMVPLLWRSKKSDLIPMIVTFLACLGISLDYGILVGIGVNLLFVLYHTARPDVQTRHLTIDSQELLLVTPEQGLAFPAAEYVRDVVFEACLSTEQHVIVVVNGYKIYNIDSTVAKNLTSLVEDMSLRKQKIVFWNWKHSAEVVCRGLDAKMTEYFLYEDSLENLLQEITANNETIATGDSTNGTQNTSLNNEPIV
ncbi:sodium-independent sulfate anion transporter-like isoform X2 [Periplaneta americana]|uniref:sodium-independent sulfate anion transporter-like isoform X2 n=1 Tax=Periplaneta americana TaxID=6978 RepID=UPI0037E8783F